MSLTSLPLPLSFFISPCDSRFQSAENSYLLTFYGFALEQNPFDSVYFSLKQYYRNNIIALNSLHRYTSAVFTHQNQPLIALHAARAYAALFSELSPAYVSLLFLVSPSAFNCPFTAHKIPMSFQPCLKIIPFVPHIYFDLSLYVRCNLRLVLSAS